MQSKVKYFFLIPHEIKSPLLELASSIGFSSNQFGFANTIVELDKLYKNNDKPEYLISFSTSIIVPKKYIELKNQISVNIHGGSPAYPGRDPHHYALYEGAQTYGATLHYMTEKVDAGKIIDVELFAVADPLNALELLAQADKCAWVLFERLLKWIISGKSFPISNYEWSPMKRKREDFECFCRISYDIPEEELQKRIKAFHIKGFNNLFVELRGRKFYFKNDDE